MAVQDSSEYKISCPRCFAVVAGASPFCPECGYNLGDSEGSDTAVYQDLAQANLSRMRGDKQGAIDQCLKVLRAYPNNVTAHSLLGEIYLEHGELKQAAEWFEMALDLEPNATREQHLLDNVKKQMEESDHKATLKQLEVKPRSGITALLVTMVGLVIIVAIAGFFIGRNAGGGKAVATNDKPAEPIRIPATGTGTDTPQNPPQNPTSTNSQNELAPSDDQSALSAIFSSAQKGSLIRTILLNPATEEIILTANSEEGFPFESTALLLSADAFVGRASTRTVTTRLVNGGKVVFVGSITRDFYDELQGNSGDTPLDELGIQAFPNGWHADASTRQGSPVKPADDTSSGDSNGTVGNDPTNSESEATGG